MKRAFLKKIVSRVEVAIEMRTGTHIFVCTECARRSMPRNHHVLSTSEDTGPSTKTSL